MTTLMDDGDSELNRPNKKFKKTCQIPNTKITSINMYHDIFCKLPIKSLVRFRCVCKEWCNLLFHPSFTKLHLSRSPTSLIVQQVRYKKYAAASVRDMYLLEHQDNKSWNDNIIVSKVSEEVNLPHFEPGHVTSCNGLVCLCQGEKGGVIHLCNPISGDYLTLPKSQEPPGTYPIIGFGFSPESNLYKVIKIYCKSRSSGDCFDRVVAEIYTLGTGTWRRISNVPKWIDSSPGVFLNGTLHWLSRGGTRLISFDLESEQFWQNLTLPPVYSLDGEKVRWSNLGASSGCLHVCYFDDDDVDLWVMKDYGKKESWVKILVITNSIEKWGKDLELIKFSEDGDVLLLCDMHLFSYNSKKGSYKRLEIDGIRFIVHSIAYVPSFISLKDFAKGESFKVLKGRIELTMIVPS